MTNIKSIHIHFSSKCIHLQLKKRERIANDYSIDYYVFDKGFFLFVYSKSGQIFQLSICEDMLSFLFLAFYNMTQLSLLITIAFITISVNQLPTLHEVALYLSAFHLL